MAIGTPSVLRTASASAATVTTASFTPAAGALLKVDYGCRCVGSVPGASTISGGGLTWTPVYEDMRDPGGTGNRIRLSGWTATATGAAMTVTCAASGSSRSLVAVTEITGAQLRQPAGTDVNGAGHPAPALPAASLADSVILAAIVGTGSTYSPSAGFTELSETLVGTDFVLETEWDTGVVITGITWPTISGNQGCVGAIMELEPSTAAGVGGFTETMALSDTVGSVGVAVSAGFTEAATTGDSVGSLGTPSNTSPENPPGTWSAAAASWKLPAGGDSKGINALTASGISATTLQGPAGTFLANSYARRTAPTFTALSALSVETWVQPTAFGRIFRISGSVWSSSALVDPAYTTVKLPAPVYDTQYAFSSAANRVYDGRDRVYTHDGNVQALIRAQSSHGPAIITGYKAVSTTSPSVTWKYIKGHNLLDVASILVNTDGQLIIEGISLDNMFDGIRLQPTNYGSASHILRHSYFRNIRDDIVENDSCSQVDIEDLLVDGCVNFYSERPGSSGTCPSPQKVTNIRRCIVEIKPQAYDTGVPIQNGNIFKLGPNCGAVNVSDCVFLVYQPRVGASETAANGKYFFPTSGTHSNNIICWMGTAEYGAFPVDDDTPLPAGFTVVNGNRTAFDAARTAWLSAHGSANGDDFPWLHA